MNLVCISKSYASCACDCDHNISKVVQCILIRRGKYFKVDNSKRVRGNTQDPSCGELRVQLPDTVYTETQTRQLKDNIDNTTIFIHGKSCKRCKQLLTRVNNTSQQFWPLITGDQVAVHECVIQYRSVQAMQASLAPDFPKYTQKCRECVFFPKVFTYIGVMWLSFL